MSSKERNSLKAIRNKEEVNEGEFKGIIKKTESNFINAIAVFIFKI